MAGHRASLLVCELTPEPADCGPVMQGAEDDTTPGAFRKRCSGESGGSLSTIITRVGKHNKTVS